MPLQAQGEFALVMEELEGALSLSGQPVKRGTMAHKHIIYMMLSDASAQAHEPTVLKKYASKLEKLALRDDHRPYLAVAHRALGIAHQLEGQFDAAESRLTQSLSLFEELESPWQIGRTQTDFAELELARGDQITARMHLSLALEQFKSVRALPDIERTQLALEAV